MPTVPAAPSHATGRQRREGSRPSGNSRNGKVTNTPSGGAQVQDPSQAMICSPGSETSGDRSP
jgi:hypothetical protein